MENAEPVLATVITPARDVAEWIGEAIDSVLAQTERRFEYVVVDDGSTDGTADVVRERAARDPRVRLVTTAHRGSATARNRGLAASHAPFVAFLDGDDRWHPDFLRHTLEVLRGGPPTVGVVFCHTRVMLSGGQVVAARWQPTGPCDLDRLLAENNPPHNGSSLLLRRSCFEEVGTFDESLPSAVDFEMWLRIAARSTTPLFRGTRRYLVDMRLMRPGCVSADRGARFRALDRVLAEYAPRMRRLHPGLAWVRPAVFAYRDGHDEIAARWAAQARRAGTGALARDAWGRALLTWGCLGGRGRDRMRAGRDGVRAGAYRVLSGARAAAARITAPGGPPGRLGPRPAGIPSDAPDAGDAVR